MRSGAPGAGVKEEVMRYLKMLGLAAVAAAALFAILGAGSASATVLCSTTAEPCPAGQKWPVGTTLDWSVPSGKQIALVDTEGGELDKCSTSTLQWTITNAGSATTTVTGENEGTTWGSCTFPTKTLTLGKTEIHKIAGTSNGTVTEEGTFEVTINTVFFGSCIYGATSGVSIYDLIEGVAAETRVNAVVERFSGSNFACPSTAKMTGDYVLTAPKNTTRSVSNG